MKISRRSWSARPGSAALRVSRKTSSASSTFPNGADTCTPCTSGRTRSSISRAIAIPSATACSLDFAFALRIRAMIAAGTTTPGTSLARNSALRTETSGQMPGDDRDARVLDASRGSARAASTSNTGCVIAYSAPASTFHSKRLSSCAGSSAAGFTPTPIANCVGSPIALPPGSRPWFRLLHQIRQPDRVDVEDRRRVRDTAPSSADRR